jgi:Domain of unknown function (DUF4260)
MSGSATGVVRILLRLEGIFFLLTACVAYSKFGLGWRIFALWFLAPDVSFFGYLAGPKFGAITYDSAHSYIGPLCCVSASVFLPAPTLLCAGIIWGAHIGFDRALGYGLKYSTGFGFTHLGHKNPSTVVKVDSPLS